MTKITFKLEQFGNSSIKELNGVDQLDDILFHFTDFLRGAGYVFDGDVKIQSDLCENEPIIDINETYKNEEPPDQTEFEFLTR